MAVAPPAGQPAPQRPGSKVEVGRDVTAVVWPCRHGGVSFRRPRAIIRSRASWTGGIEVRGRETETGRTARASQQRWGLGQGQKLPRPRVGGAEGGPAGAVSGRTAAAYVLDSAGLVGRAGGLALGARAAWPPGTRDGGTCCARRGATRRDGIDPPAGPDRVAAGCSCSTATRTRRGPRRARAGRSSRRRAAGSHLGLRHVEHQQLGPR